MTSGYSLQNDTALENQPDNVVKNASVSAKHAKQAFEKVEAITINGIKAHGEKLVLPYTATLERSDFDEHIDLYRDIIRNNQWSNEDRATDIATFISEYQTAAKAYVRVGFEAFKFLCGDGQKSLKEIFQRVEASEALRGQFGKRAPHGIDARIERLSESSFQGLESLFGNTQAEQMLLDIGTPYPPLLSAETVWLDDAIAFLESSYGAPNQPLLQNLSELDWKFLGHCRWSRDEVLQTAKHLNLQDLKTERDKSKKHQTKMVEDRKAILSALIENTNRTTAHRIMRDAGDLVALNFLNLRLEPTFSFKGPLGLAHLQVFKAGIAKGFKVGEPSHSLSRNKWALFNQESSQPKGVSRG